MRDAIQVVGAGLAGSEAAYQLAIRGIPVVLYEMRPRRLTEAHRTGDFAELVCSNSFKADTLDTPSGLLKAEMRLMGSLILSCADLYRVPAGKALAVDRALFAREVTRKLSEVPGITIVRDEVTDIPEGTVILATGPLTSPALTEKLRDLLGMDFLYFYDAISPLVEFDSVDLSKGFFASRYGYGGEDYLNLPLDESRYQDFVEALTTAETVELTEADRTIYFEGCLPIEEIARRSRDALRFGPLKPVGLRHPQTGEEPFAVVQLRQENLANTELGLVGFHTRLKYPEQRRVFSMVPGLENAEFTRFGRMHRNLFVNSPAVLTADLSLRRNPDIYLAGQITGVEGYLESSAIGLIVGFNLARVLHGEDPVVFPAETALGALVHYVTTARIPYQPSNITWGMFAPLEPKVKQKRLRNELLASRALATLRDCLNRASLRV
ncbi:MAG: methylenetetrahydrofolate--tRNA-(uracil(54)-C(5))-methyltransferase (FADH(2)-oxidizing) TrmFO [bacterium JZ-2024 1]